jgi:hypothetical protein
VPVDSSTGDLRDASALANASEAAFANGNTVDEPTIRISWREPPAAPPVLAWSLHAERASALTAMSDNFFNILAVPIIDLAQFKLLYIGPLDDPDGR